MENVVMPFAAVQSPSHTTCFAWVPRQVRFGRQPESRRRHASNDPTIFTKCLSLPCVAPQSRNAALGLPRTNRPLCYIHSTPRCVAPRAGGPWPWPWLSSGCCVSAKAMATGGDRCLSLQGQEQHHHHSGAECSSSSSSSSMRRGRRRRRATAERVGWGWRRRRRQDGKAGGLRGGDIVGAVECRG